MYDDSILFTIAIQTMVVSFVTKIAVTEYRAIGQETIVEYRIR